MEPSSLAIAYARVIATALAPTDNFNAYMRQVKWVAMMLEKYHRETPQQMEVNDVIQ